MARNTYRPVFDREARALFAEALNVPVLDRRILGRHWATEHPNAARAEARIADTVAGLFGPPTKTDDALARRRAARRAVTGWEA